MNVLDYAMMIEDSHVETRLVEYRRRGPDTAINGRGAGPLIADVPDRRARGRPVDGLLVLRSRRDGPLARHVHDPRPHRARATKLGLPHLYLGYWVEGSRKMAYKARFMPQERLGMDGWERYDR